MFLGLGVLESKPAGVSTMPRGPHDEEIEESDPEEIDKARKRLEELLRRRAPQPGGEPEEGTEAPKDPDRNPPPARNS